MQLTKEKIINKICYTELVYGRINKKLDIDLPKEKIEKLILETIKNTPEDSITKIGKNYYLKNNQKNIQITINSNTFRVITVDKIIISN